MSTISTLIAQARAFVTTLRSSIWAIDVRDGIANSIQKLSEAIEQCYSDVSNPTLQTEALEAALQNKIDEGEMAALTIGDHTITAAKLAQGVIDNTLTTSGAAADAAETGRQFGLIKADLSDVKGVTGLNLTNGRLQTSGVVSTSDTSRLVTNYFPVIGGSTVTVKGIKQSNTSLIIFYDKYLNPISDLTNPDGSTNDPHSVTIPNHASFARMCFSTSVGVPSGYFVYTEIGNPKEVRNGTYARTGSDTTMWRCTYTGYFNANDEITIANGYCAPQYITHTGIHTITIRFDRTFATADTAAGYVSGNMVVTPHVIDNIRVGTAGNDYSNTYVKSIARAINSGAKVINLETSLYGSFQMARDVVINGNGHILYGSVGLKLVADGDIYKAEYTADDLITACFVNQTTPIKVTVTGSDYKGDRFNIALYGDKKKLEPFYTVEDVEQNDDSFCWSNGYFYINTSAATVRYVTETGNAFENANVIINDLVVRQYYDNCVSMDDGVLTMNGCIADGSVNQNAIYAGDSTLNANNCECTNTWNDGINCHGRGQSTIKDCYCHDCGDDGCSQHDNCIGVINGGEFCRCGKAGIASPTNAAIIDIYNAYIHDNTSTNSSNGKGIWAAASGSSPVTFRVFGCVIKNNKVGFRNSGHNALLYGNYFSGNDTDVYSTDGTVTYLDQ